MDELVAQYIIDHFLPDAQIEIFRAFDLFNAFNYVDAQLPFINLLMAEDLNQTQDLQDDFYRQILNQQDEIFKAHLIDINENTSLFERNEILNALHLILDLSDYRQIDTFVENDDDPEHALSLIVEYLSQLSLGQLMNIIIRFDPLSFRNLKNFIQKKMQFRTTSFKEYSQIGRKLIENMRYFIDFGKNKPLIGRTLMDDGVLLNQPLERYNDFLPADFLHDLSSKEKAWQILSLIYLNEQGLNNPLKLYKEKGTLFSTQIDELSSIEQELNKILADYHTYLEVQNEKD